MFFTTDNVKNKINEIRTFVESQGFEFGIQLHNSIGHDLYNALQPFRSEIVFSVHSPVFAKYFVNLASLHYDLAFSLVQDCDQLTAYWGSDLIFFHGFFMADTPIVHDMKNYRKVMQQCIGQQYALNNSFIMNPAIFTTDQFAEYKKRVGENLSRLKEQFPHKVISLENDFPGMGSGLQRPEEIHDLIENLWFDLGHFWCSSLLHSFDFQQETFRLIEEKRIVGVHLNHNLCTKETPHERLSDSHTHFYNKSDMNLKPLIRKLVDKGVSSLTVEIVDGDIEDVRILMDWIG
jgi:hypothetical protein